MKGGGSVSAFTEHAAPTPRTVQSVEDLRSEVIEEGSGEEKGKEEESERSTGNASEEEEMQRERKGDGSGGIGTHGEYTKPTRK